MPLKKSAGGGIMYLWLQHCRVGRKMGFDSRGQLGGGKDETGGEENPPLQTHGNASQVLRSDGGGCGRVGEWGAGTGGAEALDVGHSLRSPPPQLYWHPHPSHGGALIGHSRIDIGGGGGCDFLEEPGGICVHTEKRHASGISLWKDGHPPVYRCQSALWGVRA